MPFLPLPAPDLGSVKAVRKGETEGALGVSGDGMIKPRPSLTCVKRSDQGLIAQSIDCVPIDFREGSWLRRYRSRPQPQKLQRGVMVVDSETLGLAPPLGHEALGGHSRLGSKDWDTGFPSTDKPSLYFCLFFFLHQVRKRQQRCLTARPLFAPSARSC